MKQSLIATYIGTGTTVQGAVDIAERSYTSANNPAAESARTVSVSAQTFWHEPEQIFYHIITLAFEFLD